MTTHRNRNDQDDRMSRIAATLVALAVLAEQASTRSHPLRCLILWLLRPVETIAWRHIAPVASVAFARAFSGPRGNSPTDAVNLAWRLHALAEAFEQLAAWGVSAQDLEDMRGDSFEIVGLVPAARASQPGRALASSGPRPIDSS